MNAYFINEVRIDLRRILLVFFSLCFSLEIISQCAILPNAVPGIILVHQNPNCSNNSGVAYNPGLGLYYACRAGNSGFPYETWSGVGLPLFNTTTGYDFRGLWWNPATNGLEGNGFNSMGIWRSNLNGSGYALNTGAVVLAMAQPNSQSCGDLDYQANEVLYYSAGSVFRYSRATGAFISSYAITGTPVALANLNSTTLMYTGCSGMEIALLDYVLRRVYFYNKATGAYVGFSQLPAGPATSPSFRVSWANNLIWIFDLPTITWYSYQPLNITLPIEMIGFEGKCEKGFTELKWTTLSEIDNELFSIERSLDGEHFEQVGTLPGKKHSTEKVNYSYKVEGLSTEDSYYRLKQIDSDKTFSYSGLTFVRCNDNAAKWSIYPNPTNGNFILQGCEEGAKVEVVDAYGRIVFVSDKIEVGKNEIKMTQLSQGVYQIRISEKAGTVSKKLIIE